MPRFVTPSRRALAVFTLPALGLALALLLAACGGGGSAVSAATTTVPSSSSNATLAKYTQCLTSHGVPSSVVAQLTQRRNRPAGSDSTGGGGTTPSSAPGTFTPRSLPTQYQSALQACRSLRPGGGFGGFNSAQFAAYRNCLQLHGVTLPTPTTAPGGTGAGTGGPGGGAGDLFGGLSNNPTFQAARQACAALLPARGTGPTTTATTSPAAS